MTAPEQRSAPRITPITLSDGRELIYYDESDGIDRSIPDKRDLEPIEVRSELRRDPVTDQWVIIASHRQGRTHLPATDACPLCPTSPDNLTEVPADDYDVVVFENRFPSLTLASPGEVAALMPRDDEVVLAADVAELLGDPLHDRHVLLVQRGVHHHRGVDAPLGPPPRRYRPVPVQHEHRPRGSRC